MKRFGLFAVAIVCYGVASAQIKLYGNVDAAVTYGTGSISHRWAVTSSSSVSSLFGFRGEEDLGSGLKAGFFLEAGFNPKDGTGQLTNTNNQASGSAGQSGLTFNRRSTVSLGGSWGEIRLGRDYVPSVWNQPDYDPMYNLGVGASVIAQRNVQLAGAAGARASNSIQYSWGGEFNAYSRKTSVPGLNFAVMYYLGENPSNAPNSSDGTGISARVGYTGSNFTVGLGIGNTKYAVGDNWQRNIAGNYTIGAANLLAHYESDKYGAVNGRGFSLGATYTVGIGLIRTAYSRYKVDSGTKPAVNKAAIGYIYNFSKRTTGYTTFGRTMNSGGSAVTVGGAVTSPNGRSSGVDIGLKHSF